VIDTHCHLTFPEFAGRAAEILAAAREVGVRGAITISTTTADCLRTRDLARHYAESNPLTPALSQWEREKDALTSALSHPPTREREMSTAGRIGLWHTAGVHPLYSDQPLDWDLMREAAASPRCVAWGELGLDNHYAQPPRDVQRRVLEEQLAVIEAWEKQNQLHRPLVLHCREAFDDLIGALRGWKGGGGGGFDPSRMVFHCFTGTPDDARKALDFGAWISFTGIVTFANARGVQEAAKLVPADRIMVETDSPFLTPEPMRKVRPNEPKYVVHVARYLAELRGVDPAEFEAVLDANAERFFGIRLPD
jgi:TatD DNase family protein